MENQQRPKREKASARPGGKSIATMPESLAAEAAVLGSMMIDPFCIPDVMAKLTAADFYHAENAVIFQVIQSLYEANDCKGVNGLLVRQRLEDRAILDRIGGLGYLQRVLESTPSSASVDYYVGIVREKSLRRRWCQLGEDLMQASLDTSQEIEEICDGMESKLMSAFDRPRDQDDLSRVPDLLMGVYEAVEKREKCHRQGIVQGIASGFYELDQMTGGFHPGDMVIIAGRPSMGKAQPLDALVLTPDGFTPMGLVRVGHDVIGADGKPHKVLGVFPQGTKQVYRVTFTDGTSTECCGDHLWLTQTRNEKRFGGAWSIKTCDEIARTLVRPDGSGMNHRVPWVAPVEFAGSADALPLDPYLLGLWLGDGCGGKGSAVISNPEPDIQAAIAERVPFTDVAHVCGDGITNSIRRSHRTQQPSSMLLALRRLGLDAKHSYDKFIPRQYLHAPIRERQQLLRGLLDTDGSVHTCGAGVEYSTASPQLAADVLYLTRSLGAKVTMGQKTPTYTYRGERRTGRIAYRLRIYLTDGFVPVSSRKHLARWPGRRRGGDKMIQSITPTRVKPCQCILVDSSDGLYVTNDFIVTHNTAIAMNILDHVGRVLKRPAVIFSLEMDRRQLVERTLCSLCEVDSNKLRRGIVNHEDYAKLRRAMEQYQNTNIFIHDDSTLTPFQLRSKARKLKLEHNIELVMIDYLQLMHVGGKIENRQQEITTISRHLKAIARELALPVIVLSQLNRGPEGRDDHRPRMSDLRESGCLTGDSLVTVADTGCRVPIASLVGKAGFKVWAYDAEQGRAVAADCSAVFPTGYRRVYRLRTRMGKEIKATANHRFYGKEGWARLDQLKVGDLIASHGWIPGPATNTENMTHDAAYLLGHILGNGCLLRTHANQYTTRHKDIAEIIAACATRVFGSAVNPRVVYDNPRKQGGWYQVFFSSTRRHTHNVRSAVSEWAIQLGIRGLRSHEKFIPMQVFRMDNEHIATFLAGLWETDGSLGVRKQGKKTQAYAVYSTASPKLAHGVSHLLSRFGVLSCVRITHQKHGYRDQYSVQIVGGAASMRRFFGNVKFFSEYHKSRADKVWTGSLLSKGIPLRPTPPNAVWFGSLS